MKNIPDCLNQEMINNIYNKYSNVFIIETDIDCVLENGKMVGTVKFSVDIDVKHNYIYNGDFVEFNLQKIKWKSNIINDKIVVVIKSHWVKPYNHNPKIIISIPVLKHKVNKMNNKIEYFHDCEIVELTYKQYQKKRILKEFGDKYTYRQMEAYFNMSNRFQKYGNYFKALNETSKHFFVEQKFIKEQIFPEINNAKKRYKKDWNILLEKQYQRNENQKIINDFLEEKKRMKKENNVIKFKFRE